MSVRATVTGATGFIGSYLVRLLLERGARIRALVRDPSRLPADLRGHLELVRGDLGDAGAVSRAVRGAGTVYHLAACARAWAPDPGLFREVNVEGVATLLGACCRWDVPALVHVSTILTLQPHREAPPPARTIPPTPYERTKAEGERLVEAYVREGRRAVVVHPTRVYGPGPLTDANGVSRMLDLYRRGLFRFRLADGDALANYVHVEDVARGILLAGERGDRGAHYVLGGPDNRSLREVLELAGRLDGRRRRTVPVPPGAALVLARLDALRGRLGGEPALTPGWIRCFLEDRRADLSREEEELGYRPRPLEAGLAQTLAWLRDRSDDGRRERGRAA